MSIWTRLADAAAGLGLGGPLGQLLERLRGSPAEAGAENTIAFTIGVIALGAKMAKADGVVTRDEVAAFRHVFQVPPEEVGNVARVFDLAKRSTHGYDAYARQLAELFRERPEVLEDVLDGLFHVAKADHAIHAAELAYLAAVARAFGFADRDFARIRARHVAAGPEDPYVVLGLEPGAGDLEVKARHRALVRENHPDRHIAAGMPEEFIAIATRRLAAINAAWEQIRAERGL